MEDLTQNTPISSSLLNSAMQLVEPVFNTPSIPSFPGAPKVPQLPKIPNLPKIPKFPSISPFPPVPKPRLKKPPLPQKFKK